jgi:hypothetical protein
MVRIYFAFHSIHFWKPKDHGCVRSYLSQIIWAGGRAAQALVPVIDRLRSEAFQLP